VNHKFASFNLERNENNVRGDIYDNKECHS